MVCLQLNLVGPYLAVRDGPFYGIHLRPDPYRD